MIWKKTFLFFLFFASSTILAEGFLHSDDISEPFTEDKNHRDFNQEELPEADAGSLDFIYPEDQSYSLSLGLSQSSFGGRFTVSNHYTRFINLDLSGFYQYQKYSDENKEQEFGPELSLKLHYGPGKVLRPFIGSGVGYLFWLRDKNGEEYDHSHTPTVFWFLGADVVFNPNVFLRMGIKFTELLFHSPKKFDNPNEYESKKIKSLELGLIFSF